MSLRTRLVVGFLVVAAVLMGTDAVIGLFVHRTLVQSVDSRLTLARGGAARLANAPAPPPLDTDLRTARNRFTDLYVAYVPPDGGQPVRSSPDQAGHAPAQPPIPTDLAARAAALGTTPKPFTVGDFRAVAFQVREGGTVMLAVSLRDTNSQLFHVIVVEGFGTLAVLAALGLVAWFLLHRGIRPLDQMAATADAITAGDLSRRVEHADSRTEAGRLGTALNTMLGEIEQAFEQRSASEDRLRRFVADASHELRTPLTSIRGYAELWRQGGLTDEAHLADAMRRIEGEAARMGVLVDEMLLLARLDQGRPLEAEPVDLARIASDAVADARAVEPDRPIGLDCPEHLTVRGDDLRLRQVVSNLLANARFHTPAGTPVRVRLGADGDRAVVEVEDDGPGFGPEPGRVFERFYRSDPAGARTSGGVGRGRSIVAAVSEAHGGRATAGAAPSGGALVRVELPLLPVPAATPEFA